MFARTFLAAGFLSISLMSLGCATDSAPAIDESTYSTGADRGADAQYVGAATAQQAKVLTPKPSEVRWIGPTMESVDGNIVISTPPRPPPSVDQSVALNTTHQVVPAVVSTDQPIQKADAPSIKAEPTPAPAPTDIAKPAVKVAGDSGNLTAQPAPLVTPKPSPSPTVVAVSPSTVTADDPTKAVKIASGPANTNISRPIMAMPVLPTTQPASPPTAAAFPNTYAQATKWLPKQPTRVVSFESVLDQLPTEAQPMANVGWDEFSNPKAHKWIREQLADVDLHVAVELVEVKLIRIPKSDDPDQTAGWELALTTKPERFRAFGMDTFHWPATWKEDASGKMWRGGDVRLPVTEDFAKQARFWRVGDTIVLSGTVEDIFVEGGTTNLGQPCGRFTTIFHDVYVERVVPQSNRP